MLLNGFCDLRFYLLDIAKRVHMNWRAQVSS